MERIAADKEQPAEVRQVADTELAGIRNGDPVNPGYQRVKAAQRVTALMQPTDPAELEELTSDALTNTETDRRRRIKENRAKRISAAATFKRSPRSFVLTWTELCGWTERYDVEQIAREVNTEDWALFLRVLAESQTFASDVTAILASQRADGTHDHETDSLHLSVVAAHT